MFIIKAVEFLMFDLSITLVQQGLMKFYRKKLTIDFYHHGKNKIAQHAESDVEYLDI